MNEQAKLAAILLAGALYFTNAGAVTLGQSDDFESGGEENWTAGGFNPAGPQFPPNPPANQAGGGPQGADDNYLLVTGEGGPAGPGSRLTTFNLAQWAGDYVGSGVTSVNLDVNNFSGNQLDLRLLFLDNTFVQVAVSDSHVIGPNSGWVNVSFNVDAGSVSGLFGVDPATVLANVAALRIYNAPTADLPNVQPFFAGTVGFDNISAVPLPPAVLLFMSGIAGLWAKARKRS